MDPGSVAGLALGGASLAFQVFMGVVKGFEYFESAANATTECESFKIVLKLEYGRIYDWGEQTGVIDKRLHDEYNRRMRHSQSDVVAILSELKIIMKQLRDVYLKHEAYKDSNEKPKATNSDLGAQTTAAKAAKTVEGKPASQVDKDGSSSIPSVVKNSPDVPVGSDVSEVFQQLIAVPQSKPTPRKHVKGLNHILDLTRGLKLVGTEPKRFVWAFRDKKKFVELLPKIKVLVDHLHETLSDDQLRQVVKSSRETQLAMVTMSGDLEEIKSVLWAVRSYFPGSTSSVSSDALSGTTLVNGGSVHDGEIEREATPELKFKTFVEAIAEFKSRKYILGPKEKSEAELKPGEVASLNPTNASEDGLRSFASFKGSEPVYIEWKTYTAKLASDPRNTERVPDPGVIDRVAELAALLRIENRPEEFSVLPCLGYYMDKTTQRFGFVFKLPDGCSQFIDVHSLSSLMPNRSVGIRVRTRIALQLSQCLSLFHAVDWLHKGLRSASIMFHNEAGSRSLGRAYIGGFEYARPLQTGQPTTGPSADLKWAFYTHPDYLELANKPDFRKTYDIYSLGIILVELAYWRKIDEIFGFVTIKASTSAVGSLSDQARAGASRNDPSPSEELGIKQPPRLVRAPSRNSREDIRRIRDRILDPKEGILDQIEDLMGEKYRTAVHACILGPAAFDIDEEIEQSDPLIGTKLQQEFTRVVIDVLASISV